MGKTPIVISAECEFCQEINIYDIQDIVVDGKVVKTTVECSFCEEKITIDETSVQSQLNFIKKIESQDPDPEDEPEPEPIPDPEPDPIPQA
jgi:transcription elongation factor Elf1